MKLRLINDFNWYVSVVCVQRAKNWFRIWMCATSAKNLEEKEFCIFIDSHHINMSLCMHRFIILILFILLIFNRIFFSFLFLNWTFHKNLCRIYTFSVRIVTVVLIPSLRRLNGKAKQSWTVQRIDISCEPFITTESVVTHPNPLLQRLPFDNNLWTWRWFTGRTSFFTIFAVFI